MLISMAHLNYLIIFLASKSINSKQIFYLIIAMSSMRLCKCFFSVWFLFRSALLALNWRIFHTHLRIFLILERIKCFIYWMLNWNWFGEQWIAFTTVPGYHMPVFHIIRVLELSGFIQHKLRVRNRLCFRFFIC